VFTPDPCFGYPPKSSIQLQIQGNNPGATPPNTVANTLTDWFGNKFTKDAGLQWTPDPVTTTLFHSPNGSYDTLTGLFTLRFQTKGTKPQPAALRPGSALQYYAGFGSPCRGSDFSNANSCIAAGNNLYYTTANGLGQIDLRGFINRFNQGITDFTGITITPNTPVTMGRPGGVVFDRRQIPPISITPPVAGPTSFHTFIYVVNEKTETVDVVRSDTFQTLGRLAGFQSPRDVAQSLNTSLIAANLFVSNFGSNEVVAVNLDTIKVSFSGQPGAPSPCDTIKDNQSTRKLIPVNAGPTDISSDGPLDSRVMVCESLHNSVSIINVASLKVLKSYDVGSNPVSCDWVVSAFGTYKFAVVANQGGLNDPDGSASLYVNTPPLQTFYPALAQTRDSIEFTLTDGVRNPTHVWGNSDWTQGGYSSPQEWMLSNTGGTTSLILAQQTTGVFGLSLSVYAANTINMGPNPSSTILDPYYPNAFAFASVLGTGSLMALDPTRSLDPVATPVPGIRRLYTALTH
jgi:hypothetical protein